VNRRTFVGVLGMTALAPRSAHAQRGTRVRRIAVLMLYEKDDPAGQARSNAFQQQLQQLGWTAGRNIEIDFRWGLGDAKWIRSEAETVLTTAPEVIVANGGQAIRATQAVTRDVPIVFIGGSDPVADGFVRSLSRPGGNATGFTTLEPSVGAKLLGLLKEAVPRVSRVGIVANPDNPGVAQLTRSASEVAQRLAIEFSTLPVWTPDKIERAITDHARATDAGLIVPPDPSINTHRKLIVELTAKLKLPTIYALRAATAEGGLMSYGIDIPDLFRKAAVYADRILRGEKPADLPVQQPTKFEMVINLRTARALGLDVPQSLLVAADEVIQ